ncbi:MAG: tripartite tricarboxylate transporter substrate binding protein [Chloroflexi bacterium]|nr:tripartite tricarboxylate transporter substrate binding protein [Chloroflexota bacterium]
MNTNNEHGHLVGRRWRRLLFAGVLSVLMGALVVACGSDPTATPVPQATATPTPEPQIQFPEREIEWIVGWPAGGGFDLAARTIGDFMGKELGVDVVVRNHTGAGGRRAVDAVRRGQPDGYTISIMNMPMQLMAEKLDPAGADFEGFEWIGQAVRQENIVQAPKTASFNTPEEVAAAEPRICMPGLAGHNFLVAAVSTEVMGIPWKVVSGFQGGADTRAAMLRGECDISWTVANPQVVASISPEDDFKGLWVYSDERLDWAPDTPTVAELGYPELGGPKLLNSGLVAAPAGTPPEIINLIEDSFQRALQDADVIARLREGGMEVLPMTGQATDQAVGGMDSLLTEFTDVVRDRQEAQ